MAGYSTRRFRSHFTHCAFGLPIRTQVRHEMNRISEDVKVYLLNPQAGSAEFDNLFGKQEIENKPNTPSYTPCYLDKRYVLSLVTRRDTWISGMCYDKLHTVLPG